VRWLDDLLRVKTGEGEDRKARLVGMLESITNGACLMSYLIYDLGHREVRVLDVTVQTSAPLNFDFKLFHTRQVLPNIGSHASIIVM
jgi:hypothetical protein